MTPPIESCLPGCYKICMIAGPGVQAYVSDGGFPAGGPVPDYFCQAGRCQSVVGQPWAGDPVGEGEILDVAGKPGNNYHHTFLLSQ